ESRAPLLPVPWGLAGGGLGFLGAVDDAGSHSPTPPPRRIFFRMPAAPLGRRGGSAHDFEVVGKAGHVCEPPPACGALASAGGQTVWSACPAAAVRRTHFTAAVPGLPAGRWGGRSARQAGPRDSVR